MLNSVSTAFTRNMFDGFSSSAAAGATSAGDASHGARCALAAAQARNEHCWTFFPLNAIGLRSAGLGGRAMMPCTMVSAAYRPNFNGVPT